MLEKRIFTEIGVAARIAVLIESVLPELGFQLVRVRITGERGCTLQIMAERFDGSMSIDDCEQISQAISPLLEVEDPIDTAYHLEISSPGMDRPLVRIGDFKQWLGHEVKIEMSVPVEGRRRFRGKMEIVTETSVALSLNDIKDAKDARVVLLFSDMAEAQLVLNDETIQEALKRGTVPQIQDDEDVEVALDAEEQNISKKITH